MDNPPSPPSELPAYVVDPLQRQDDIDRLKTIEGYVRELIRELEARQAAKIPDEKLVGEDEELTDKERKDGRTYVVKRVPCGKDCNGCPHGPYKYSVKRVNGELEWKYHGPVND